MTPIKIRGKKLEFGKRRAVYLDITDFKDQLNPISNESITALNKFDL